MPILRSLARGLDTGMDSYVRQRLLNREREDKQARQQAEEDQVTYHAPGKFDNTVVD